MTDPIKKAFEKAAPGTTLEVQNRNTNAGVKFLEETKANNQVDLFWASAPDAFEVLKGKKLLQKPTSPRRPASPRRSAPIPINDQDGFYFGFAASGYGIMWNERYVKANKLPDAEGMAGPRQGALLRPRLDLGAVALGHHASHHRDHPAGRGLGQGLAHHQGDRRQLRARSPSARSACPRR